MFRSRVAAVSDALRLPLNSHEALVRCSKTQLLTAFSQVIVDRGTANQATQRFARPTCRAVPLTKHVGHSQSSLSCPGASADRDSANFAGLRLRLEGVAAAGGAP